MAAFKRAVVGIKNKITKSPLERQVAEACSDENWGVQNTLLREIAEKTYNPEDRQKIMKATWEYLKAPPKEWRRLYKTLNLVEFLVKFGSNPCVCLLYTSPSPRDS